MGRGQQVKGRACRGLVYRGVWCGTMSANSTAPRGLQGNVLIRRLRRLVMYEQAVVCELVVRGVLCLLCV